MSGFQFPPPPPPPPSARTSSAANPQQSYSGAPVNDRGRGRGRGRGHHDGRGRGRGRGNGGFSHPQPKIRNLSINNAVDGHDPHAQPALPPYASLPAGSYVNPTFRNHSPFQSANRPVSTSSNNQSTLPGKNHTTDSHSLYPARTVAGHKRKLEALREPHAGHGQNKPGPPTAPPVPGFGTPLLQFNAVATSHIRPSTLTGKKGNALGLTPHDEAPRYSSSDSEDEAGMDEEAIFAELGENLTFEHNGTVMSLNTAADLASWKKERAKNFPTKARMAAKLAERRQIGEERKRLLIEAHDVLRLARQKRSQAITTNRRHKDQERKLDLPDHSVQAAQTPGAGLDGTSSVLNRSQPNAAYGESHQSTLMEPANTDGVEAGSQNSLAAVTAEGSQQVSENENASVILSFNSDSSGSNSSTSSVADSDEDGPPEETTSKRLEANVESKKVPCRFFTASGYCRDGQACRYKHELPNSSTVTPSRGSMSERTQSRNKTSNNSQLSAVATSSKKSIHDRLVEQEQSEEDLLALQVIKYLGNTSFFASESIDSLRLQQALDT